MLTRKINNTISIASHSSAFLMKMWCAVLLAKFIWWIITPAYNEVYVDRVKINQKDSSVKYIINRYPFGEVVVIKAKDVAAPEFSTLVKLHGVYVSGSDSIAFIEYSDKNKAVRINGNISPSISITKISPDSIVITQNGVDAIIRLTQSTTSANTNSRFNGGFPNHMPNDQPQNSFNNNFGTASTGIPNNQSDLIEKRKELIEKFAKQELNDDNTTDSNSKRPNLN